PAAAPVVHGGDGERGGPDERHRDPSVGPMPASEEQDDEPDGAEDQDGRERKEPGPRVRQEPVERVPLQADRPEEALLVLLAKLRALDVEVPGGEGAAEALPLKV